MAKVIQVIEVDERRGRGVEGEPFRIVTQYWSLDGELLAENDPHITDRPTPSIMRGATLLKELYGGGHKGPEGVAASNGER